MANRRAMARLHELLLRVARGEAGRRRTISPTEGSEEVDELSTRGLRLPLGII